jgi:hypothetical protein
MPWSLLAALLCLAVWVVTTFITPLGIGFVHVFLAAGVILLIRWWALRDSPAAPPDTAR